MPPDFMDKLFPRTARAGIDAFDQNTVAWTLALLETPARSLRWPDGAQNVLSVP